MNYGAFASRFDSNELAHELGHRAIKNIFVFSQLLQ